MVDAQDAYGFIRTRVHFTLSARCMSSSYKSVTKGSPENRDVGSIADGMAPSTPTAALRLCLQQRGTRTGLPDISARPPATVTTNSPEAHHLQRVADKVFLGTLKPYAGTRHHFADPWMLARHTQYMSLSVPVNNPSCAIDMSGPRRWEQHAHVVGTRR